MVNNHLLAARSRATEYEAKIELGQRKRLGQFFTGLPLSRLLAALSLRDDFRTVLDPMGGHGDLLDAVLEEASIRQISLDRVDGIEIDPEAAAICRERLNAWTDLGKVARAGVATRSAFDSTTIAALEQEGYDLVITNPPYVRYQVLSGNRANTNQSSGREIRASLLEIAKIRAPSAERDIWMTLINGYSGLADLSVPSWILAALLVRIGGILALVAPATWRSRDYASVLRYLLCRCFEIEVIVADKQPGWFSEALVRTHLIVARRKTSTESIKPLDSHYPHGLLTTWVEIAPSASTGDSLVGTSFNGMHTEHEFAIWLGRHKVTNENKERKGISVKYISATDEARAVMAEVRSTAWIRRLELVGSDVPLFDSPGVTAFHFIPRPLRSIVPFSSHLNITTLEELGIKVGQGLRTGCNGFFYVTLVEYINENEARIRAANTLGSIEINVPSAVLRPVIRGQADVGALRKSGREPEGQVLDLREFVLPEDYPIVDAARALYISEGRPIPQIMPPELANFVKQAAHTVYEPATGRLIPELSAVRTNVRDADLASGKAPRFWYMLPDFSRRHLPDAFLPRVNHNLPWVIANTDPPILIDANFCTIWSNGSSWPKHAIVALLNSCWSQACMEALGTSLGGGALKLEATHLRKLPIPRLSAARVEQLDRIGRSLFPPDSEAANFLNKVDAVVMSAVMNQDEPGETTLRIVNELRQLASYLQHERGRGQR